MNEYDSEPVRGLPGRLPEGERILWQGAPDAWVFARNAFHTRWVAAYFVALALYGVSVGSLFGVAATAGAGVACIGLLYLLAWAIARTSVYTLTNKRVVLRIGVALNACFNLPLSVMKSADLRPLERGHGDIALALDGATLGYLILWPHARPWRLKTPQPMLRAVPEAEAVAAMLVKARAAVGQIARGEIGASASRPADMVLGAAA